MTSWDKPAFTPTKRDIDMTVALHHCRIMRTPQSVALFFDKSYNRRKQAGDKFNYRSRGMYDAGFWGRVKDPFEVFVPGNSHINHTLGEGGIELLRRERNITADLWWNPDIHSNSHLKLLSLPHTLMVSEVYVAVNRLCNETDYALYKLITESEFRSPSGYKSQTPYRIEGGKVRRIFPDMYTAIIPPGSDTPGHFFIEVDRNTESTRTWKNKVWSYLHLRRSGDSQRYYNTQHFRILTICPSQSRVESLVNSTRSILEETIKDPQKRRTESLYYYFALIDDIDIWDNQTLLKPIWHRLVDDSRHALF